MQYSPFVDRIKSQGGKAWDIHFAAIDALRKGEDVIVLSVGDPDFNTPTSICDSAIAAIKAGDTHYMETKGHPDLRAKIVEHFNKTTQYPITADNVVALPGTQNGLYCAAACLLTQGDDVLVPDPAYLTYEATLKSSGANVVPVPTSADDGFRLEEQVLRDLVTPQTKAIFFANPNNPTGRVMDQTELDAIANVAREYDLWVVSDEVYATLSFDKPFKSIRELEGMQERTIVISSLSKSHAMTGWRAGWMIANPTMIEHMDPLLLNMLYGLPGFVQQAAITALDQTDEIVPDMLATYRQRRDVVKTALANCSGITLLEPDAGMFILVDIRQLHVDTEAFTWALYKHTGVSTLDAAAFGDSAKGFIRLSFTLSTEKLADACQRIKGFIDDLAASKVSIKPISTEFSSGLSTSVEPNSARLTGNSQKIHSQQVHSQLVTTLEKKKKVIQVENLHKRFGDHEVLKGVSLTAREGDVISLIGGSGSGKSTLLRCINMLEIPNQGVVYIDNKGIDIGTDAKGNPIVHDQRHLTDIRSSLGMVFQSFNLWPHRTVLENLIEAPIHVFGESKAVAIARAEMLLERVGMAHKKHEYPSFLSGGQQQRVAIARALAVEPKAMLFDEPTSALDPELVGEVLKVIRSLAEEGRTMILVTHEMAFARDVSSHVAFLHQGIIEEQGAPADIFTNPQSARFRQFISAQDRR
ncbi:aminotransferase class I/II-fold pyridoxal phosphate-dependent enzyme [Marinomonas agarivorans]|nr:aminotransferase class I/II-fold pyridoxal phosphate-dependent enzyme [Marinomonas agarivorans]